MSWVATGAAAITAVGTYASSKSNSKSSTTSESPEVLAAQNSALSKATDISNRAYTPYTGERIAGLSLGEQQASQLAETGYGESKSYLDQATNKIGSVQSFKDADMSSYMNPYTDAVLKPQLSKLNQSYDTAKTSALNSKAGAFGGDRAAMTLSELDKNYLQSVSDVTGQAYSNAFDKAVQTWSQDQNRQLQVAQALQSVGNDVSKLNQQQIQDLMLTGGTQRLLDQAQLDFDYQQFVENRDWSVTNLQPLLQAISASKGGSVTTTQSGSSGALGQALGAGMSVLGMYYGNKSTTSNGLDYVLSSDLTSQRY